MTQGWKAAAEQKRQSILDAIPAEWRLKDIPSAEEVKDITGPYIEQYLSAEEIEQNFIRRIY